MAVIAYRIATHDEIFICNMNVRAQTQHIFFNNRFYLADQVRDVLVDLFSSKYFGQIWIGRPVLTKN
jgi:hypothetical protein